MEHLGRCWGGVLPGPWGLGEGCRQSGHGQGRWGGAGHRDELGGSSDVAAGWGKCHIPPKKEPQRTNLVLPIGQM